MQEHSDRIQRFIDAFEQLYGRKPQREDAFGNFIVQVAQDMRMSVGGALRILPPLGHRARGKAELSHWRRAVRKAIEQA